MKRAPRRELRSHYSGRERNLLTLVAVVASLLAGCGASTTGGGSTTSGRAYVAGGTLTIRSAADFRLLDPQLVADSITNGYLANSYATLLYLDRNGKLEGYLAKSWKASATTVTFTLKSGVTCADGTPVKPTVVKNSIQRMFDIKDAYQLRPDHRSGPGLGGGGRTADQRRRQLQALGQLPGGALEEVGPAAARQRVHDHLLPQRGPVPGRERGVVDGGPRQAVQVGVCAPRNRQTT